jgi:hypothetical protein
MRRTLAVLTILVATFGFISAASPATSSAANCSTWVQQPAYATNAGQGDIQSLAGFYDHAAGAYVTAKNNQYPDPACCSADWTANASCTGGIGSCDRYLIQYCWWWNATRNLYAFFTWQIKGATSGTWGPLHSTFSAYRAVTVIFTDHC